VYGQRRYHPDAEQRIAEFQLARQAGSTIAAMQTLAHGVEPETPGRWRALAQQRVVDVQQPIELARQV
jgi:hypothetical protein